MPNQNFPFKQWGIQFSLSLFSSFFPFQMHFLPTSSLPKMHFPSDLQQTKPTNLRNCQIRLRQLTQREHTAVLRHSNQESDTQQFSDTPQFSLAAVSLVATLLKQIYLVALLSFSADLLSWSRSTLLKQTCSPCNTAVLRHGNTQTFLQPHLTRQRQPRRNSRARSQEEEEHASVRVNQRQKMKVNQSCESFWTFQLQYPSVQYQIFYLFLWTLYLWFLLLLSSYHTIILLLLLLQLSYHHQIIILFWM